MDALILRDRISKTLELGESQFREFKSCLEGQPGNKQPRDPKLLARDIIETVVAFANADGGELLLGVEDDGTVTGVPHGDDTIQKLLEVPVTLMHKDTPLDSPIGRKVLMGANNILYFSVEKSTTFIHQTSDGKCLQRKDRENRPVSADKLRFEREEQLSREYDRQFIDDATVAEDLDLEAVKRVSEILNLGMSVEKCLQYLGLAEFGSGRIRLRKAALLLFAKDIIRWHPRCQVRLIRIRGNELKTGRDYNVVSDDRTTGNVFQLVQNAWEKLRPHLVETKMTTGGIFRERVMYPEDACREAMINAITHRNYRLEGQSIEIQIYDDRMEVQSPGGLLSTLTLESLMQLKGLHESRNAFVARVLRELGYVREMGEGLRRIFALMRDSDLVAPELHSEPSRFSITLRNKSVFSESDQKWIESYKPIQLSREEMMVALLGKDGKTLSPQQIYDALVLVDWDVYRSFIEQMQTKGLIKNVKTQSEKVKEARRQRISQREVPRMVIRSPWECEAGLSELFDCLRRNGPVLVINGNYMNRVVQGLSSNNPYKASIARSSQLLKLLNLTDENKRPLLLLKELWTQQRLAPAISSPKIISTVISAPVISEPVIPNQPNKIPRVAIPVPIRKPISPNQIIRKIFINNLPYNTSEADLRMFFEQYGKIDMLSIPQDVASGRGRGFGILTMATHDEAARILEELNGKQFGGRQIIMDWYSFGGAGTHTNI